LLFIKTQPLQCRYTGKLDHGRGPAHEELRIILVGGIKQQVLVDQVLVDKASRVGPGVLGGLDYAVNRVPQTEASGKGGCQVFELLSDENVFFGLVGIEELDAGCRVGGIAKDGVENLEHGCNAAVENMLRS
jgi:hypothetical protein